MATVVNPIIPPTALLKHQMPGVYMRSMVYDPTWDSPTYNDYTGQRIVPAVGSIVQDGDETPLWVVSVHPVTMIPEYVAMPLNASNDNVVSLLNYGNSVFRLYTDYRHAPYSVTPDYKCIFIGKSPRFYSITRYPRTSQESVISQYYDATGKLASQLIPLKALDETQTSWYLQKGHINAILDDNEEVAIRIFNEDGIEVGEAIMHAKESSFISDASAYNPTLVGITVSALQRLPNGSFFLYEKQDFTSLGISVTLVYSDGTTSTVPVDGLKCVLYGQSDFISSFSGLTQYLTVKYFRSENEAIDPSISDPTGSMISTRVAVTVIPNTLGTTVKIMTYPVYNTSTARYVNYYRMHFGDGRPAIDVSPYVTIGGTLHTNSAYFGIQQTCTLSVDMNRIDPAHYPLTTVYTQTLVVTYGPPTQLVKYTIRDSATSPYIFGQDNSQNRRPILRVDRTRGQMYVPASIFGNLPAFLRSFYTTSNPPFDPTVTDLPQAPTHFLIRSLATGSMLVSAPLEMNSYAVPFNLLVDFNTLVGTTVIVEFVNIINVNTRRTLYSIPVEVSAGAYVAS